MIFTPTSLTGSYIITTEPRADNRGWFTRYFCKEEFQHNIGHQDEWVQMNHSFTATKGSIRGMHFQFPPHSEIKMVRCIAGAIFDVIIDLRQDSPSFLQWTAVELSSENKKILYIPRGFAHGFQTLEDNCELLYHHSAFYNAEYEAGLKYDDPVLNIQWPLPVSVISQRDASYPYLDKKFKGL